MPQAQGCRRPDIGVFVRQGEQQIPDGLVVPYRRERLDNGAEQPADEAPITPSPDAIEERQDGLPLPDVPLS